jgi:RHS repeat-associated protein
MVMPGRKFSSTTNYRYGFNGKEEDDDVKGDGNQQDYGLRIYDPRLGKFLSVDPLTTSYPWYTPYQFAGNSPIANIDLDGAEPKPSTKGTEEGQSETTSEKVFHAAARGSQWETKQKTWFWHSGGHGTGVLKNGPDGNAYEEVTKAGWYTSEEYTKTLSSTTAAKNFALVLGLYHGPSKIRNETSFNETSISKFVGGGLNSNAEKFFLAASFSVANQASFNQTGITYFSSFNVEDLIGVGLLLREGVKTLGTYTAKNLASRGIDFIRSYFGVGIKRNVATLGGTVDDAGYYSIGISGVASREGTVGVPVIRRFTTSQVGGYDRLFDSEVKLLEGFAERFHKTPNVKGVLTLTSELQFCPSCTGVITQFNKMFPNIQLNLINGVK